MADLRRFTFNSDYPVEQVVFFAQAEVTTKKYGSSNFGSATVKVSHNLPFIPLPYVIVSQYEDFSDARSISTAIPSDDKANYYDVGDVFAYADHMQCTITSQNPLVRKVYVRFYGLRPPGEIGEVAPTSMQSGTFMLNTGFTYAPLVADIKKDYSKPVDPDAPRPTIVDVSKGYEETIVPPGDLKILHGLGAPAWVTFWAQMQDDDGKQIIKPIAPSSYIGYLAYYEYTTQTFNDYVFISEEQPNADAIFIKVYANV